MSNDFNQKLTITLQRSWNEEGRYVAMCKEWPDITAYGDTPFSTMRNWSSNFTCRAGLIRQAWGEQPGYAP